MTTSNVQSSIEALLNPATNRPAFRNDTSVSAERGLQFEKQLSDAQNQSNSQRALQRQNASERAAQDAARRRTATERQQADEVAEERDADKRAADKKAAERAASQKAALAKSILKTGEQGAQIDLGAEQTYHAVKDTPAVDTDSDPAEQSGVAATTKTKVDAAAQMSSLAEVLAAEAATAKKIAEAMAGGDQASGTGTKLPTVTSVETTSGPDGIHTRLSIELSLDKAAQTSGAAGTGLNADAVAALSKEQNAVLAALLGLNTDTAVDSASGVKGLTGTTGAAGTVGGGATGSADATGQGALAGLPDGASITTTTGTSGSVGSAGSAGATTPSGSAADAASQVAGAAAAGITQTGASSSDQTSTPAVGQTTGTDTGASATLDADAQAAMSSYVPYKIMVDGQWMSGSDWAAGQDADSGVAGAAGSGAAGSAQAAGAAGALADSGGDESDAQNSAGTGGVKSSTGSADQSQSIPAPDAFSSLMGQVQQTQQPDQPNAVTGSGYSTAAGESVAEQVGQQLAAQLRSVRDGNHRAVIHLSPKDLGDVTVTLNVNRGDVQLSLIAAPAALTQLQAGLNDLRDQMSQAGLNLGDVSMQQSMDTGASMTGGGGSSADSRPNYSSGGNSSGVPAVSAAAPSTPTTRGVSADNDLDVLI